MLVELRERRLLGKRNKQIKELQNQISRFLNLGSRPLFSDLTSVETRDGLTTARLQLESLSKLLEHQKCGKKSGGAVKSGWILDIGGNIGIYANYFSSLFPYVVTIEPNPEIYEILKLNTRGLSNVKSFQVALSSRPGVESLRGKKSHTGSFHLINRSSASTLKNSGSYDTTFQVSVITYDELRILLDSNECETKLDDPSIIKIDVEGHELEVLKGLHLERFQTLPQLLLESNVVFQKRQEIVMFLRHLGYRSFFTTTRVMAYGSRSRYQKVTNLLKTQGISKMLYSFNSNQVVELKNPEKLSLELLLANP